MAEFIDTSRGLLNLDHVLWIRYGVGKEAGESFVQLVDGRIFQCQLRGAVPMPSVPEPKPTYADEARRARRA